MPDLKQPQNAVFQFKCANCGIMFSADQQGKICPGCGYYCNKNSCQTLEASDEGY